MRLLVAGYLMWFASSVTFQSSDFQQGEGVPVSVPWGHDCVCTCSWDSECAYDVHLPFVLTGL